MEKKIGLVCKYPFYFTKRILSPMPLLYKDNLPLRGGYVKGLSSFVSEAILLVLVISGTALIVSNIVPSMLHVGNGLTSDNGEIRVSYIMYSNGYIYAYNYGDPINVSTPVEAYIDNGWKNTTIIDSYNFV